MRNPSLFHLLKEQHVLQLVKAEDDIRKTENRWMEWLTNGWIKLDRQMHGRK